MLPGCMYACQVKLRCVSVPSAASGNAGGAQLYVAAGKLKDLLRSRAILLVSDRPDIADAVEADGIILSQQGTDCQS